MKKVLFLISLMLLPIMVYGEETNAVDYIKNIAISNGGDENSIEVIGDTGLAYDNTKDKNLRYVGLNPNNYVDIGDVYKTDVYAGYFYGHESYYRYFSSLEQCENSGNFRYNCIKVYSKGDKILWRIIGVMNNINKDGKLETKLKLIRNDNLGMQYPSDVNEWNQTFINELLNPRHEDRSIYEYSYKDLYEDGVLVNNSLYWNSENGYCHNFYDYYNCDFSGIGLTDVSKKFIDTVTWDTGTYSDENYYDIDSKPIDFYNWERTGKRNIVYEDRYKDGILRTAYCNGKIGLMYVSDLGYATSGSSNYNRNYCLNLNMLDSSAESWPSNLDCQQNSWLNIYGDTQLTMDFDDQYAGDAMVYFTDDGYIIYGYMENDYFITPVFYLNNDAQIFGGSGTEEEPYKLVMPEKQNINIKIGEKQQLKELLNNNEINWITKNNDVIEIKDGEIRALKVGTTTMVFELLGTIYTIEVDVISDDIINPLTQTFIGDIIVLVFLCLAIFIVSYNKIKENKKIEHF